MNKHFHRILPAAVLALTAGASSLTATAGELQPLVTIPDINFMTSKACAPYGDFMGCSSAILNWIANQKVGQPINPNANQNSGPYTLDASQGFVSKDNVIKIYSYGSAIQNPTIGGQTVMDDAYKSQANPSKVLGFSTNKTPSAAELAVGVTPEPDPATTFGPPGADTNDTWDIQLSALLKGLHHKNILKDPLFVFDNNQQGASLNQDLRLWGSVTLRAVGGNLPDLVYEFRGCDKALNDPTGCANNPVVLDPANNTTVVDPTVFQTDKKMGDDPLLSQYALIEGQFCVDSNFIQVDCADKSKVFVKFDNNLGSGHAEFAGWMPDLTGAKLLDYYKKGYNTMSVDMRFYNQNGGFEDLYIAGVNGTPTVPEPGTLALAAGGLLAWRLSRRRQAVTAA